MTQNERVATDFDHMIANDIHFNVPGSYWRSFYIKRIVKTIGDKEGPKW